VRQPTARRAKPLSLFALLWRVVALISSVAESAGGSGARWSRQQMLAPDSLVRATRSTWLRSQATGG
jgi:hypothetical protein